MTQNTSAPPWRQFRHLTIADWMAPLPHRKEKGEESPLSGRIYVATKEPTEAELLATLGHGKWHNTPKERHVVRMYISAALSVFAEVMRPSLEQRLQRLFGCFSEVVEAVLPYWDGLCSEEKDGWAKRAQDTHHKDHYVYLRARGAKPRDPPKRRSEWDEEDEENEGYETDPDELPGIMCDDDQIFSDESPPPSPSKCDGWKEGQETKKDGEEDPRQKEPPRQQRKVTFAE